jgi:hypothetical protein
MYVAVEPMALRLLELLASGAALAPACEREADEAGIVDASELEPRVAAWFQAWAAYGWVTRVDF